MNTVHDKRHRRINRKLNFNNSISRIIFVSFAILLEIAMAALMFTILSSYAEWVAILTRIIAVLLIFAIFTENKNAAMKMPWIILISATPIIGVFIYLMLGFSATTPKMKRRYAEIQQQTYQFLPDSTSLSDSLIDIDAHAANMSKYLYNYSGYPLYKNTDTVYYSDTNVALEEIKNSLRKAESFIFIEYFSIEMGHAFSEILDILTQKVEEGVEVRILYDDVGSARFINKAFAEQMNKLGIKCLIFNPFTPVVNWYLNYRDHRKLIIIDGIVSFTGGCNLCDEYFNIVHPFGHWKDAGIKLVGDATLSFTASFLEMWNGAKKVSHDIPENYSHYLAKREYNSKTGCYIQPFVDSPLDNEQVGENVYISMIESANRYIYFMTPYLVISDEMAHALRLAAKRGVDVRIITPGIPDKKAVYELTRSYYKGLVTSGVRVYEYTPGFLHSKLCVTDDNMAFCGTINMDYRSLYHSFEDGVVLYGSNQIPVIKKDFDDTFPQCEEVTKKYLSNPNVFIRIERAFLRLFSPMV